MFNCRPWTISIPTDVDPSILQFYLIIVTNKCSLPNADFFEASTDELRYRWNCRDASQCSTLINGYRTTHTSLERYGCNKDGSWENTKRGLCNENQIKTIIFWFDYAVAVPLCFNDSIMISSEYDTVRRRKRR